MDGLARLATGVLGRPWLLALGVLSATIAKYGIGLYPAWTLHQGLAANWTDPGSLELFDDWVLSSPLQFVSAAVLNLDAPRSFMVYSLVLTLIAVVSPFLFQVIRESRNRILLTTLVVAGGSLTPVLLQWVGGYDPLTVIAAATAVLARNKWIRSLGWFAFAANHAFIAGLAFVLVTWLVVAEGGEGMFWRRLKSIALPAIAVLVGALATALLTTYWGMQTSRLDIYFMQGGPWTHLDLFVSKLPLIVFSTLGVTWLVLLANDVRSKKIGRQILIQAVCVAGLIPLLALDQTRVSALVLFAPILYWISRIPNSEELGVERVWRRYSLAAFLIPVVVVWTDSVVYSGWQLFTWLTPFGTLLDLARS